MKNAVIYIHGKNGLPTEADYYKKLFGNNFDVIGFDYKSQFPWQAEKEFQEYFDSVLQKYRKVYLIANSIGAYFALISLSEKPIKKVVFISPIVDMEHLIKDMMKWSNITENELKDKKQINTNFGETLSWKYLIYARNSLVKWNIPTCIVYGDKDNLTSKETIIKFAEKIGAILTIMKDGEHWFHTDKQMKFIENSVKNFIFDDKFNVS